MELFEAIKKRRSIRAFKKIPLTKELLYKIIEAGRWAPSAGNCQAREIIIVEDFGFKKELALAAYSQAFIHEAQVDLVVCAHKFWSSKRYGNRGSSLYCILDSAAAIQNILLAIHALGLGGCCVSAFDEEKVRKILQIPKGIRPIAIIPIGYPNEKPRQTSRKEFEAFVHLNLYGKKFKNKN